MPVTQEEFNKRFKNYCSSKKILNVLIPGAELKSKYEKVLTLIHIEEKSHAEAADILHMSKESVGNLICKARKELKKSLDQTAEFSDPAFQKLILPLIED